MRKTKSHLVNLQKNLYQYMKEKAMLYEDRPSIELKQYTENQREYSNRDFSLSGLPELLATIEKSNIVYLGDFHTFDQNSRNMERILRTLINTKKTCLTLGVEFIQQHHQKYISQYLKNLITEHEFLESIEYQNSWQFPWGHYRFFFQMAKKHQLHIIALNSSGSLPERDDRAASSIIRHLKKNPTTTLLILFGELHIVPNRLPKKVSSENSDLVQTIIHQNLDEVFWKLKEGQRDNQVIKYDEFEFSIQSSPPWVKYESMIYWYENILEDPEFDIHEYMMESGLMAFNSTVYDTFNYIAQKLVQVYRLDISAEEIEDFNLYDHTKMDFVLTMIDDLEEESDVYLYKTLVSTGKSFKFPNSKTYYCSSYSINRISFLAGLHIQEILLEKNKKKIVHQNKSSEIISRVYQMLMAYFSSKIINPYRKCNLYKDLIKEMNFHKTHPERKRDIEIALKIIDLKSPSGPFLEKMAKEQGPLQIYRSSKIVGYFLGDVLYDSFYKKDKSLDPILKEVHEGTYLDEEFNHLKWQILPLNDYQNLKKRFF